MTVPQRLSFEEPTLYPTLQPTPIRAASPGDVYESEEGTLELTQTAQFFEPENVAQCIIETDENECAASFSSLHSLQTPMLPHVGMLNSACSAFSTFH